VADAVGVRVAIAARENERQHEVDDDGEDDAGNVDNGVAFKAAARFRRE
jgi:hypothetical protein